MRKATVIAALDGMGPPVDERERACREQLRAAVEALADPFDRHADLTHLTGSAIITGPRGIVLLLHKKMGMWLQPGGHLDPGEAPADAALREGVEETGLALAHGGPGGAPELLHIDVHAASAGHVHLDMRYRLVASDGGADPSPPEGESQHCRWFGWDEAAAIADPGLAGLLAALRP